MSLLVALATLPTKNFSIAVCTHAPMHAIKGYMCSRHCNFFRCIAPQSRCTACVGSASRGSEVSARLGGLGHNRVLCIHLLHDLPCRAGRPACRRCLGKKPVQDALSVSYLTHAAKMPLYFAGCRLYDRAMLHTTPGAGLAEPLLAKEPEASNTHAVWCHMQLCAGRCAPLQWSARQPLQARWSGPQRGAAHTQRPCSSPAARSWNGRASVIDDLQTCTRHRQASARLAPETVHPSLSHHRTSSTE